MKNTEKRPICLLMVMIAISIAGCVGCTGVGDENLYVIEQLYFKAEKLTENKLNIKPELLSGADYDQMIDAYMAVVNTFELNFGDLNTRDSLTSAESAASRLAGKSVLEIAFLYDRVGKDHAVIETLHRFSERFPHNRDQKALALLQLGRVYVKAGDTGKAHTAWMDLVEDFYPPADGKLHPNTEVLALPVELARLHYEQQDSTRGRQQLDFAEGYYEKIINDYRHSPLGMTAVRYLADTYMLRNKPREAVALLETVTDSAGAIFGTAQLLIAEIYLARMGDTVEARKRYESIVGSERDSLSHPQAYMQLAKLEFIHGNFNECRKHATVLKSRFENYRGLQPEVQQLVARSFDKEGDFGRAFSEYQWLLTGFPDSKEAIDTYRYLPEFLRTNEQPDLAAKWEDNALSFFSDKKRERQGTAQGLAAHSNLINLLVELKRWDEAATELELLQAGYPQTAAGAQALAKAGNIYGEKLSMVEKARHSYQRQLDLYPDMPISEDARVKLKELENP